MIETVLTIVVALFPVSEIVLAFLKRSRGLDVRSEDRGSWRLLWLSITLGVTLAVAVHRIPATALPGPRGVLRMTALALLVGGLTLRWCAILTLGRLFTVDVAIHSTHALVQSGLYRFMRHPSYTGLLVAFLGLGVYFRNWLSIVLLLVPIGLGIVNRVLKEERALMAVLGPEYASYCARTKRFVPGVV